MDDKASPSECDQRPAEYRASHGAGLRGDKTSGVILICLSAFFAMQSGLGFLWGLLVYFVFLPLIRNSTPPPAATDAMFSTMSQLMLIYMPFSLAGAILLIVCGSKIVRGSDRARRFARWIVLAEVAWLIVFNLHALLATYPIYPSQPMGPINSPTGKLIWMLICGVGNAGIVTVVVAFLLFILSRPKQAKTPSPGTSD